MFFQVKAEDVGVLKKVLVRHDNTGLGAGWFLEKVTYLIDSILRNMSIILIYPY